MLAIVTTHFISEILWWYCAGTEGNVGVGTGNVLTAITEDSGNFGINNTAIGRNAGSNITTGDNNVLSWI